MIDIVFESSINAPARHPYQVLTKLTEELGELAKEVNIEEGFLPGPPGKDGVMGEAIDVIQCALDLIWLYNPDVTEEEIRETMQRKTNKWKSYYEKNSPFVEMKEVTKELEKL